MNQVSLKLPAYVIADVHLSGRDPATQKLLFRWLDSESFNARSLIILGDLFDAWIGDDAIDPVAQSFANHLQKIIHRGVDVFFVAGNRDFLLGDEYARKAGMKRLDEPLVVDNIEPPTALIHGDVLCTDDKPYQRFRTRSRDPIWQDLGSETARALGSLQKSFIQFVKWLSRRKSSDCSSIHARAQHNTPYPWSHA